MYNFLNNDEKIINRYFDKTPKCLNEFISQFNFSSNVELSKIIRKTDYVIDSEYISSYDDAWEKIVNRYKKVLIQGCNFGRNTDLQTGFQHFYDELFWITEAHLARQNNERGHVFFIKVKDYEIFGCSTQCAIYEYFIKNVSGKEVLVRRLRVF